MHIPQGMDGQGASVRVRVLACRYTPVVVSGTARRIALNFGVWLDTNKLTVLPNSGMGYICARAAHLPIPFPYLWNGWTDCAEIWLEIHWLCVLNKPIVGYICTCAAHPFSPFSVPQKA